MSMASGLERALLRAGQRGSTIRLVRVKIGAVSPLTITLPDGTTIPALAIVGLTYTAGGAAVAMIAEGIVPVALPTT